MACSAAWLAVLGIDVGQWIALHLRSRQFDGIVVVVLDPGGAGPEQMSDFACVEGLGMFAGMKFGRWGRDGSIGAEVNAKLEVSDGQLFVANEHGPADAH